MTAPSIFVSPGTLVPTTPLFNKLPWPIKVPLHIPHKLGIGPSPDRFLADTAYGPLKSLQYCWVEPLVTLGLAERAKSIESAKTRLRQLITYRAGARIILLGQSQGALVAAEIALDPEFSPHIAACVMAGGPFLGSPATQSLLLGWTRCFPGIAELVPDHPSLKDLSHRIATSWPAQITPVVVGAPEDELVPLESAFGAVFPRGVRVRNYWLSKLPPGQAQLDLQHLEVASGIPFAHLWMCRRSSLVELVRQLRAEFTSSYDVQSRAA